MKKLIYVLVLMGMVIFEPEPIEPVKPALIKSQYRFEHTGRYYQKVKMPDGSRQELKSLVPLTDKQWEEKAKKAYVKPIEPEFCPHCGSPI